MYGGNIENGLEAARATLNIFMYTTILANTQGDFYFLFILCILSP
jgi:hypothetical protein